MDKINVKHLMFIIWGITIVSLKTNINTYLVESGRDSWISMIIACIIMYFYFSYILKIYKRNNIYSFVQIYKQALGNMIGTIFLLFFLLSLILILIECGSVEANTMHTNMFIETPHWYLILFFVIPAIYSVKKSIASIVNITIVGMSMAILAGINLVILTAKYKHYEYLLPIMANGITTNFIVSIFKILGLFSCLAIVFPYFIYLNDYTKLKKYCLISLLFVIQMQVISVIGTIAQFNIIRAEYLTYPKLTQTQVIDYFGFIESGELFVMFQTIGGWFVKYVLTFFIMLKILRDLNYKNKYITYAVTLIVGIASFLISQNLFLLHKSISFLCYISLINFFILPIIIFTLFNIKNNKKQNTNV